MAGGASAEGSDGCQPSRPRDISLGFVPGADLEKMLPDFGSARVAVVGDFCLDAYWDIRSGDTEFSIETGLPVNRVTSQRYSPGGAGNVVANLVSLGVGQVRAIGLYGRDPFGRALVKLLAELGGRHFRHARCRRRLADPGLRQAVRRR